MKYLNKTVVFFLFMLVSFGVDISAYTYTIANMTGRDVKVRLHYELGKLNKQEDPIESYDTHIFSFTGGKIGACLTQIVVSSFDEEVNHLITLTAPIKVIDRELFDATIQSIKEFNTSVKKLGKLAALLGPTGVAVGVAIDALADVVEATTGLYVSSLCRSRDFILVVDYDPVIKLNRVYALTHP